MLKILENDKNYDAYGDDENFEKLLQESFEGYKRGALQNVKIIQIGEDVVKVALDSEKLEYNLPTAEIMDENGKPMYNVGDKIEVQIIPGRGRNVSHKKAARQHKVREKIASFGDNYKDIVIEAKLTKKNRGGFILEDSELEYFLPRHESAIRDTDRDIIGKTYKVAITSIDKENNSITVSRKRFFDIDDKRKRELAAKLSNSQDTIQGVVKSITSFGAFVDVGGENGVLEGLVHFKEISHRGNVNPSKYFNIGDKVEVKVIQYDSTNNRLSLSTKALSVDPWEDIAKELEVGYTIKVVVSNIVPFGAFVSVSKDVEAFLHISEIAWEKNIDIEKYIKQGDEINVEVIEIDIPNKKMRVSLKSLTEKPISKFIKNHKQGDKIKGKVIKILDFGAFIDLGGIDGLLKNEDISWEKGKKASDIYKVGDEVEVIVHKIENEKITLSKKLLEDSPASAFAKEHAIDSIVNGAVTSIKEFGVFIQSQGVDILIRNDDLYPLKKEDIKLNDNIECAIVHIDRNDNKIRASIRKLERIKEKENLKAFSNDEKMTLGDLIKNKI